MPSTVVVRGIFVNVRGYYRFVLPVFILLLVYLLVVQHRESTVLEKAISNRLNEELHALTSAIEEIDRLYDDVTATGQMTEEQARILMTRYENIRNGINGYRALAVDLKERDESYRYDTSSYNADRLTHLYADWHVSWTDNAASAADLDEQKIGIVDAANQLNDSWNDIAIRNRSVAFLVQKPNWLQLLDDMEASTTAFLDERGLTSIEQVWFDRDE